MAERSIIDQLDDAVSAILAGRESDTAAIDQSVVELVAVAQQLRGLPRDEFKKHLKDTLVRSNEMSSPVMKPEPALPSLSVYLCFNNAAGAIEYYKEAFGAEELMRLAEPGGKIGHAEIKIGEAVILMSDEYPDYGAISPQTLGGSPMKLHLSVLDVDSFVAKAVSLGANLVRPIEDQSYGHRSGQITDPFGYTWIISTHQKDVPVDEMQKQFDDFVQKRATDETPASSKTSYRREGFHTVTPYLTVEQPAMLLEFTRKAFLATELGRTTGSPGGLHAETKIGDSMLMIGGGVGLEQRPTAIHLYVPDVDAAYQRSLEAGATSLFEPADQPYGERSGAVQDPTGNRWYIATPFVPLNEIAEGLRTITLYLHPIGAQGLIDFLRNAFGSEEVMRHQAPDGMILHAKMRIGDSIVELGESRGGSLPMPTAVYMYVEDVDALYERALKAGAVSVLPPTDQPYGDRNAWVKDPFDNIWYLATHLA
ncbi:MAG TPA: VOC family protein [Pyrinomonadaceae bacterium]|nr:VOC family protein [Pyrinomonadaceae bacterium]